jgi:hypothetical protein
MPELKSIFCVHCGYEVGPHDTWTLQCWCGTKAKPMPNPENRLAAILDRLNQVSGEVCRWRGSRYQGNGIWDYTPPDPFDNASISSGDLCPIRDTETPGLTDYFEPNYMGGSDYSGGSVEVANHKVFLEEFGDLPGVHEIHGDFDTYGVVIRLDCITSRMVAVFTALSNYPVICEEVLSDVEREAEDEAWDNWVRRDYERAVVAALNEDEEYASDQPHEFRDGCLCQDCLREAIGGLEDLRSVFKQVASRINVYWSNETGNSATVNVERIAAATTLADLALESGGGGATTTPAEGG